MNAPNDALKLGREKLEQMRADGIEVQRLTPTEKALADPASYPKAIRATCFECLGGDDCTNIRDEIAYCTAWGCALWHRRPHQHLCADPARWPHKRLDRDKYGEPFGQAKREAALGNAKVKNLADRLLLGAVKTPGSNTAAIRARCLQCTGSARADITQCKAEFGPVRVDGKYRGCPLYPVRPYQNGQDEPDSEIETKTDEPEDF